MSAGPPERSRLVGIEGVRGIAASSILVYHVWLYGAPGGQPIDLGPVTKVFENLLAGVTLFFVLSGFLLYRPYVAAALRGGPTPSVRGYLRNRALRIAPAYWFILAAVALLLERSLLSHPWQLLANAFLAQDYVPSYTYGAGIVPAWSLAIEVVFYLAVPLLGALAIVAARRAGPRRAWAAFLPCAVMVAVGFGSKIALHLVPGLGNVWGLSLPPHADWFAAGMTLAVLRVLWEDGSLRLPRHWQAYSLAAILPIVVVTLKLHYDGTLNGLDDQSPIAWACALLLAPLVLAPHTTRAARTLTLRPVAAVGAASYSLFLWHDPLVRYLRDEGLTAGGRAGFVANLVVVAILAGIASALTYRFVEQPALRRKRGWQRPSERAPAPPETAPASAAA